MSVFYLRYLEPKESGAGTIVHECYSDTIKTRLDYMETYPHLFKAVGFYNMLRSEDRITVEPEKKKK